MFTLLSRHRQNGYMLEIPLLLVVVMLVMAFLLPSLSPLGRKIAIVTAAAPILFCLYYMIITPGWQPNKSGRLKPPWNWLVFLLWAAGIVMIVVMFLLA